MHPRPTNTLLDYPTRLGNAIDAIDRRLKGNLIDNGAFQVWQRGTSIAVAAARTYGADRWVNYRTGFALGSTVSRQTGGQAQYCARVQRDNANAGTGTISFVQQIETVNCIPFRGRYVKLGFRARAGANYSSAASALTATINTGTGTDEPSDFSYTGLVTTSESKTLTASFQDFEMAPLLLPAGVNEIAVSFSYAPVGTAGANDYFELEEVQLVPGEYVGLFPYMPLEDELSRCQRHFCKSFALATAPAQNIGAPTGQQNFLAGKAGAVTGDSPHFPFPVRMRASPAMTLYNPLAANAQIRDFTAVADMTASAAVNVSERGFCVSFTGAAGTAVGNPLGFHWAASSDI